MVKGLVTVLHILLSLFLIAVVLLQSGRSAGLSGTIAGGAEAIFGKKKGLDELLGKMTTVVAILFGVTALLLGFW
ncbi:MAG: preprotein translocase subunit SecG [Desulfotomaculales bacterium]